MACSGEGEGSTHCSGSGVAAGIPPHPKAPAPRAAPKGDTSRAEPRTSSPRVPVTEGPRPGDPGWAERNPLPPGDAGATTEPPRCNFVLHRSLCFPYVTRLLLARCSPPRPAQLRCNVELISTPWNGSAIIISWGAFSEISGQGCWLCLVSVQDRGWEVTAPTGCPAQSQPHSVCWQRCQCLGPCPSAGTAPVEVGLGRFAVGCPCWHWRQLLGWSHGDCAQRIPGLCSPRLLGSGVRQGSVWARGLGFPAALMVSP